MTSTDTTHTTAPGSTRSLLVTGVLAAVAAAVATTAVAAIGRAAGISLEVAGEPIPLSGFAFLTMVFSLIGLAMAVAMARWVRQPRRVFVRTTVALTVLSLVPDLIADAAWSTRVLLIVTHLVAAAIVIPAVARRLR